MTDNVAVFYHVYVCDNVQLWIDEQLNLVFDSGLIDICKLHIILLYKDEERMRKIANYIHNKFDMSNIVVEFVREHSPKPRYEAHTLCVLRDFCKNNPEHKVLYFHTKGISRPFTDSKLFPSNNNKPWTFNWRNSMQWHCIVNHVNCLSDLDSHDIVGTKWIWGPSPPHFSGNFWWANASYINTLTDPMEFKHWWLWGRFSCEFWIGGSTVPAITGRPSSEKFIKRDPQPKYKSYPFRRDMFTSPIKISSS